MSKVNYEDVWDEDPFHPCLNCGGNETQLDLSTNLYSCVTCGKPLVAPPPNNKKEKRVKKKVRLDEDWN
tara:strand:- start:63 stop:269 length:207 start_codon:yes stop_codon:yes gene_type:complete